MARHVHFAAVEELQDVAPSTPQRDAPSSAAAAVSSGDITDMFRDPSVSSPPQASFTASRARRPSVGHRTVGPDGVPLVSAPQVHARLRGSTDADIPPDLLTYHKHSIGRNSNRPSIGELLFGAKPTQGVMTRLTGINFDEPTEGGNLMEEDPSSSHDNSGEVKEEEITLEEAIAEDEAKRRFGIWDGVVARCLLNIWGVVMFLRLGYMVASAGVGWMTAIVLISMVITTITTLSLSAIATNGHLQGGGAYYMISRALGPQFGGAIGILFTVANALGVALYLTGFAEAVLYHIESFGSDFTLTPNGDWDIQIYGLISLVVVLAICLVGVDWVVKIQLALLFLLVWSIGSVIVGAYTGTNPSVGFVGPLSGLLGENMGPDWGDERFASTLALFFPAATGIMAGANMSGEIRKPGYSIPWGTLIAIVVSGIVYVILIWVMGSTAVREVAPGVEGLRNNLLIMADMSFWDPLIYAGIYAATLSSAIASLVGAPRILQAVARDNLFPVLKVFGKGHGKNDEPWNGYFVCFAVAFVTLCFLNLNDIAPLLTEFFMAAYALVNLACFAASQSESPGWRPSFKWYSKWGALAGFFICVFMGFLMNWVTALITVVVGGLLYGYIDYKDPDVSWGSAPMALKFRTALKSLLRLQGVKEHIKIYRPQILVLAGDPKDRPGYCEFAYQLRKSRGILMYGRVVQCDFRDLVNVSEMDRIESLRTDTGSLRTLGITKAFQEVVVNPSFAEGALALMQLGGVSRMRPNVVMMGFREKWLDLSEDDISEYVRVLRDAFFLRLGVIVTRNVHTLSIGDRKTGGVDRTIDIYWLFDDGGLTMLLPYILTEHKHWRNAKLRLMVVTVTAAELGSSVRDMKRLLAEFRIDAEIVPVPFGNDPSDPHAPPTVSSDTVEFYRGLHDDIPESALGMSRTSRYLRLRELYMEYSCDASLIVTSMPIPDLALRDTVYMSWLHLLSEGLPPVMFIRGNQEDVLTFDL